MPTEAYKNAKQIIADFKAIQLAEDEKGKTEDKKEEKKDEKKDTNMAEDEEKKFSARFSTAFAEATKSMEDRFCKLEETVGELASVLKK